MARAARAGVEVVLEVGVAAGNRAHPLERGRRRAVPGRGWCARSRRSRSARGAGWRGGRAAAPPGRGVAPPTGARRRPGPRRAPSGSPRPSPRVRGARRCRRPGRAARRPMGADVADWPPWVRLYVVGVNRPARPPLYGVEVGRRRRRRRLPALRLPPLVAIAVVLLAVLAAGSAFVAYRLWPLTDRSAGLIAASVPAGPTVEGTPRLRRRPGRSRPRGESHQPIRGVRATGGRGRRRRERPGRVGARRAPAAADREPHQADDRPDRPARSRSVLDRQLLRHAGHGRRCRGTRSACAPARR